MNSIWPRYAKRTDHASGEAEVCHRRDTRTHPAGSSGGWRRRAGKEKPRNLRDPHWAKVAVRESDDPIVALKGLIRLEPRGSTVNEQQSKRHAVA